MTTIHTYAKAISGRNKVDRISFAQGAETALEHVSNILQYMRALAVQAASCILNARDRNALQVEFRLSLDQIEAIVQKAKFNGISLFTDSVTDNLAYPACSSLSIINLTADFTLVSNGLNFDQDNIVISPSDGLSMLDTVLRQVDEARSNLDAS
jgi:flagellin